MFFTVSLVLTIVLYVIIQYIFSGDRKLSKIKCETSLPFIGHALKLGRTEEEFLPALEQMWIRMGRDKFILKFGTMEQIVLTKPQDVEMILSSSTLVNKSDIYKNIISKVIGNSSIMLDREQWRPFRKITNQAFSFKILDTYVGIFQSEKNDLIEEITMHLNKDIDVIPIFNRRSLNTICKAAIGYDSIFSKEEDDQFIHSLHKVIELANKRVLSWWKSIDILYNFSAESKVYYKNFQFLRKLFQKILDWKKEELKELQEKVNSGKENIESILDNNVKKNFSFIELLLLSRKENNQALTDIEMLDEVNLFISAGYETTSGVSSFTAYNLALHPEIQENAYQEQLSITGGDLTKQITQHDLNEMKYLERVIKESSRIYAPVAFFGRKISEKTVLSDGTELPIGTDIFLMPYLSHRDPEVFDNPEKFDPDRFLKNVSNYTFFPFSAGPRNCVGRKMGMLETKFWLAVILRNFKLLPSNKEIQLVARVILTSSNGIPVHFTKREN